ncbi:hypothetical protein U9M48_027090 [Paspalum notatum var. saurae]|uniref:DUF6598 domain-containing protein n=1 Tax=Paspalum notatum var. saurae TaxID=547442 RepID=A0AAQ3TU72_PASNO
MRESDRAAEAERLRQEKLQEARRLQMEGNPYGSELEGFARILDFDPKQGGIYYNKLNFVDLATFGHDEESPIGPMRFTDRVFEDNKATVCDAVNILSVKIACSDIGFPIHVYGTVVARDCTDYKRIDLFRRDSDHCQLVNSKKESLILTGPNRGLALSCDDYVETDLKGVLTIWGVVHRPVKECKVETVSLATRLSTVNVMYAVVKSAVEATIAVEVLQGEFYGVITAHTAGIRRSLVLYDTSKVAGDNCHGVIQLMRSTVSVYVRDTLIIFSKTAGGISAGLKCTPRCNGGDEIVFPLGDVLMRVRVACQ